MAPRVRLPLVGAALCAVAFLLLLAVAYGSATARRWDATSLQGFVDLQRPVIAQVATAIGHLGDALPVAVTGFALAVLAAARSRPRIAVAILLLVGATSVSSQLLKVVLAYTRFEGSGGPGVAAFPSGHATAAMTLALAAVVVAPRALRPLAGFVGGGFALAVSFSVLANNSHFPSDIVAGYLLATGWTLVVVAALHAANHRWPERTGRTALGAVIDRSAGLGLAGAAAAGVALVGLATLAVVVARPSAVVAYAQAHTTSVVVALAVAVSAAGVLGGVTAALRTRG